MRVVPRDEEEDRDHGYVSLNCTLYLFTACSVAPRTTFRWPVHIHRSTINCTPELGWTKLAE